MKKSEKMFSVLLIMISLTGLLLCGSDADTWAVFIGSKLLGISLLWFAAKKALKLNIS